MIFSIISWNMFIVGEASSGWREIYSFPKVNYVWDSSSVFISSESIASNIYNDVESNSNSGYIYVDVPLRFWDMNASASVNSSQPVLQISFKGFYPKIVPSNSNHAPYVNVTSASLYCVNGQFSPIGLGTGSTKCFFDLSDYFDTGVNFTDMFFIRFGVYFEANNYISNGVILSEFATFKFGFSSDLVGVSCRDHVGAATSGDIDRVNDSIEKGNEIAEETKETTKGIFSSITEFFGSFFQNLIDSVIGLFVPSSDEMSGLFDQLNQFFSDRFGFLYAPFDYMIQLLGVFTSAEGSTGLTFPGFSIMGYEVWSDLTYDLASDELVGTILEYVRIGTGILLGGWFIMYLQDFFKERFSQ